MACLKIPLICLFVCCLIHTSAGEQAESAELVHTAIRTNHIKSVQNTSLKISVFMYFVRMALSYAVLYFQVSYWFVHVHNIIAVLLRVLLYIYACISLICPGLTVIVDWAYK